MMKTNNPKPVMLFRRRMIHGRTMDYYHLPGVTLGKEQERFSGAPRITWYGSTGNVNVRGFDTPHAAARALERKIESQWKRLGKLTGKL